MAKTVFSATAPYCTVEDLFVFHDPAQCADMVQYSDQPRPSIAAMLNSTSAVGIILNRILLSAAGKIESTAIVGLRYAPEDLTELAQSNTAGAQTLIKLNADIAFWQLCQRKQPNASDPKNVPGAMEAVEYLKQLAEGEAIFGFLEAAEAGLPSVVQAAPGYLLTPNVVRRAYRLFPNCYINNLLNGGPAAGFNSAGSGGGSG